MSTTSGLAYVTNGKAARGDAPLLAVPPAPRLTAQAPSMPYGFYGSVMYVYQDGRLTMVEVLERIKPAAVGA